MWTETIGQVSFLAAVLIFLQQVRELEERGLVELAVPQVYGPPFVPLAVAASELNADLAAELGAQS